MRSAQAQSRSVIAVVAGVIATVSLSPLTARAGDQPDDAASVVRARVETYEQVWNTHRASAVAAFFEEDADMVFGNGPRIAGRAAIEAWWDSYFARIDDARQGTFAIESLRLITPEVAILNVASTTAGRDAAGQELPTRLARGTWVLIRRGETWWISALRGLPAEGDVRSGPGVDR